ncbi:hypothetical protein QOT17_002899 [Balamuthia mandrillaris]
MWLLWMWTWWPPRCHRCYIGPQLDETASAATAYYDELTEDHHSELPSKEQLLDLGLVEGSRRLASNVERRCTREATWMRDPLATTAAILVKFFISSPNNAPLRNSAFKQSLSVDQTHTRT